MYQKRLRPAGLDVETEWHKTDSALVRGVLGDREKGTPVVLLDPKGKSHTSEQFASDLYKWLEEGGSRLVCVIGGGTSFPSPWAHIMGPHWLSSCG
jgi:23S rRNA pseudoU1915 N3-methylase RlmH